MGVAEKLGFGEADRVVVVHVDDIGMCAAATEGAVMALEGVATCGSIMVPCPDFEGIARRARERPDLDLGVHLTLNAEYEGYRWGPLRDDVPGLVSPDGGMWRTTAETVEHASPEEVDRELRAQIDRALDGGIDVTHLDSHMGTVFDPRFVGVYVQLSLDYRLPAFFPRVDEKVLERVGMSERLAQYVGVIERIEQAGFPVFDHFNVDSLSFTPGTGADHNARRFEQLEPGLSFLNIHAARGDAELESIAPDWRQRDEERQIYSDGTMERTLTRAGVRTVGMRPLRDLVGGA
ncbi:MAG: polysaccharide deacetylase family protein [Myxococcota bacterium]